MKGFFFICIWTVLLTCCFANIIDYQEKRLFRCNVVKPVPKFSLKQFSNTWYEIAKINFFVQRNEKCNLANISAINSTQANFTGYHKNIWTNKPVTGTTLLYQKYFNIPAILAIGPPKFRALTNYTIVDIDYKNYVVIHTCTRIKIFEFENAYILSPRITLDRKTVEKAKLLLKSFGVNTDLFTAVDQINC